MREKIIGILESIHKGVDYDTATSLIDSRVLDSLSIISLVAELNYEFNIELDVMDLVPENLNSVDAMVELITSLT